ncbi:hypothetical protein EDD21DRAFT_349349 [Dissophora ornata]|nr:hypothetical protein EDD21DRAFT_349349 [Dissophora ornata]
MADTDAPSGFPDPAVFRKYAHLVRSLACNNIQYHLHYLAPYCSQLTELDVIDLTVDTLPLLRLNNETLTSVKFKREHELVKRSFRVLEFLQALSQCPSLDQLRLVDFKIEESSEVPCAKQQQQQWTYFDRHDRRRAAPSTISSTKTKAEEDKDAMAVSLLYEIVRRLSKLDLVRDVIMVPPKPTEVFYKLRRLALLDSTMSYRDQLQLVRSGDRMAASGYPAFDLLQGADDEPWGNNDRYAVGAIVKNEGSIMGIGSSGRERDAKCMDSADTMLVFWTETVQGDRDECTRRYPPFSGNGFNILRFELLSGQFSPLIINTDIRMGMNEVEFMMEHWKKLRKVIGTIGVGVYDGGGGYNGNGRRFSSVRRRLE